MSFLILCGPDAVKYGELKVAKLESATAAISVGSDPNSPSLEQKAGCPNEDALLIMHSGSHSLLAVADGHFGTAASHSLLNRIAERCPSIPKCGRELMLLLLGLTEPVTDSNAGTSLVVVVYDREGQKGFGIGFGDSSACLISKSSLKPLNQHNQCYLKLHQPIPVENGSVFRFRKEDDTQSLLLFTDGVNECDYESPETSIQDAHILQLYREAPDTNSFVRKLGELALTGVDGNPGGQDNITIAAQPC